VEILRATGERLKGAIRKERLLETATRLIEVPSPTGEAGAAADCLARILAEDGFRVERPVAGHPRAPAVAVRWGGQGPGPVLQFDGHLDTVHLPFVPPRLEGDRLRGSGSADMKAGLAAAVEALRALRDAGALLLGSILLTAHDLHEAPWGRGEQLDGLIGEGWVGDGVLLPEPLSDRLPVAGRGAATWKVTLRRAGPPVHEVMRPAGEPSVIAAAAELVARLDRLGERLSARLDPVAGSASVFVGQIHSGEIYNQYPAEAWLEGTRRWLPGTQREEVEAEFRALATELARDTGVRVELEFRAIRDSFSLDPGDRLVAAFEEAHRTLSGTVLPRGPKPFVDDGNSFSASAGRPAITHGPRAGGQHTLEEWVSVADLARVAHLYAMTAVAYCVPGGG
jgi:acetylornithine deacetylase/succinyl-diaminopimelate desuccinylase-like protein